MITNFTLYRPTLCKTTETNLIGRAYILNYYQRNTLFYIEQVKTLPDCRAYLNGIWRITIKPQPTC
jgi:hypothetical protein